MDYETTQTQLRALATMVLEMPLDEFLEAIARAEAAGPIVDPTLRRERHVGIEAIRRLASALLVFRTEALRQAELRTLAEQQPM